MKKVILSFAIIAIASLSANAQKEKKETKKESKSSKKIAEPEEIPEDELSDIEVDDDVATMEPELNDEVLMGSGSARVPSLKARQNYP